MPNPIGHPVDNTVERMRRYIKNATQRELDYTRGQVDAWLAVRQDELGGEAPVSRPQKRGKNRKDGEEPPTEQEVMLKEPGA